MQLEIFMGAQTPMAPMLPTPLSLQADSRYSNTAVTLIEQSHVYS